MRFYFNIIKCQFLTPFVFQAKEQLETRHIIQNGSFLSEPSVCAARVYVPVCVRVGASACVGASVRARACAVSVLSARSHVLPAGL